VEENREVGCEEGRKEVLLQFARNLFAYNQDIGLITPVTGLPDEAIVELKIIPGDPE
jgi:hypothetical protein